MKPLKYELVGHEWKMFMCTPKKYAEMHGGGSVAITDIDKREIYFRSDAFTLETVRHELVHAYVIMFNFVELDLCEEQTEEFFAELFGKHGEVMVHQATEIFEALSKKIRKSNKGTTS